MRDIVTARRAVRLYVEGASLAAAGLATGMTHAGVRKHLVKAGVERRYAGGRRKPAFDLVMMRANGLSLRAVSRRIGVGAGSISERLGRLEARGDLSVLLRLTPLQIEAYRSALDDDRLPHPDALDLALEYEAQEAA